MKKFFKHMANHNPNSKEGDCFQLLKMMIVKTEMMSTMSHLLPASKYAAARANQVLAEQAEHIEGKRRGAQSGPKGMKLYGNKEQERLANSAARVQREVVECQPCAEE